MEAIESHWAHPLSGLYKPTQLRALHYGPNCVKSHLLSGLPSPSSRAFILSTSSLAKTPLLSSLQSLLSPTHHAATSTSIRQHAPLADLDAAAAIVLADPFIDTIISVGGGSPIDAAKVISHRVHESGRGYLWHIAIPTTLSAAECTFAAGYTNEDGIKSAVVGAGLVPQVVFYDAVFARETPARLWLSTGMRALDHAVETLYHPTATEVPMRTSALGAIGDLFTYLPRYKEDPEDEDVITKCQLAAFASIGFLGLNVKGGLGLSHALGYALGSPYGIPHGITSCLTLGHVVRLKAGESREVAGQIARAVAWVGGSRTGDDVRDALEVGERILGLVRRLGLESRLGEYGVGRDQVPVIVRAATRAEGGELYEKVTEIVEGLY